MSCASAPSHIVFIVSGDSQMRQMLRSLVVSSGLQAVTFGSAAEYRDSDKPDAAACLILNVNPPDMSGFDLQQQVAHVGPPIVFVTNHSDVRSCVRAIQAGAVDFLTSPFRDSELLHAVNAAISRYRDTRVQRAELARLQQHFALLTPREREVLTLVVSGLLNKQSACELGISEVTLQVHRSRIMQKMAARSLADLVRMATMLQIPLVYSQALSALPNGRTRPTLSPPSMTTLDSRNARREPTTSWRHEYMTQLEAATLTPAPVA
jgi:FixJ family two-component response regulator